MPRKKPIQVHPDNLADSSQMPPVTPDIVSQLPLADDDEDNLPLQAPKNPPVTEQAPAKKPKKPQTEAQKRATAIMRQRLAEKWERSRAEKIAQEAEHKRLMEEKILAKAISIKKKQIKAQKELDVVSDDDTPMEEIIPLVRKSRPPATPKPAAPQKPTGPRIIYI